MSAAFTAGRDVGAMDERVRFDRESGFREDVYGTFRRCLRCALDVMCWEVVAVWPES